MSQFKPIVGLAGGIGSGKSLVATQLAQLGAAVFNADIIAKQKLKDDYVKTQLTNWWGTDILDDHNEINRKKLAALIFNNTENKHKLENLIHPMVDIERQQFMKTESNNPNIKMIVLDVPLLFEVGLDKLCNSIIFVDAPENIRIERVNRTRGWDAMELKTRENSQSGLDNKRLAAEYIVTNDSSESHCFTQVQDIFNHILNKYPN